jgi:hypothetical protein
MIVQLSTWIEAHPGAAAWVQAVGSLVAIGIAIWVPAWQRRTARRDARDERLAKARSLLMLIGADLIALRVEVDAMNETLSSPPPAGPYRPVVTLANQLAFNVPRMLRERIDSLYLFGEPAGLTLQQLVSTAMQSEKLVQEVKSIVLQSPEISIADVHKMLGGHFRLMWELGATADMELKPFDVEKVMLVSD